MFIDQASHGLRNDVAEHVMYLVSANGAVAYRARSLLNQMFNYQFGWCVQFCVINRMGYIVNRMLKRRRSIMAHSFAQTITTKYIKTELPGSPSSLLTCFTA